MSAIVIPGDTTALLEIAMTFLSRAIDTMIMETIFQERHGDVHSTLLPEVRVAKTLAEAQADIGITENPDESRELLKRRQPKISARYVKLQATVVSR